MDNLKEMIEKLNEINSIINEDPLNIPAANRASYMGLQRAKQQDLLEITALYKRTIARNIELVLIKGEGEADGVKALNEMGIVTVNAQNIFEDLEKTTAELAGSNRLTTTAFTKLDVMINNLYRLIGLRKPAILHTEETGDDVSMSENARNVVRRQFGGAGIEPASVFYEGVNLAFNAKVAEVPVLVVAFNLKGAIKSDYQTVFNSVHEYTLTKGDNNEVIKMLKNMKQKLKDEGKLEPEQKSESKSEEKTEQKTEQNH